MTRRRRIAYLCDFSPLDTNSYSGGNNRIYRALQTHVGDVTILDNGWGLAEPVRQLCHALPEALNLRLRWRMHLALSRVIAAHVHRQLRQGDFDTLFCAYSFQSLFNLRIPAGIRTVFTTDALPTVYKTSEVGRSFGSYASVSRLLDPLITRAERKICKATDLLLWPTEWLKSGAEEHYDLGPDTAYVVPWGANIATPELPPDLAELAPETPLHLLLVGRDFWAKGGGLVIEALKTLRARGIDARLDIIGGAPPKEVMDGHVTHHGMLNKADPEERARFEAVMAKAHFLFQPSFESYGFAFCEASAYGLPSLCLRVGGVPVRDEVNGHALPMGSHARDFCSVIEGYLSDPERYTALRKSTRAEFDSHLNWDAWGKRTADLLGNY